jgi:hypothetical protein
LKVRTASCTVCGAPAALRRAALEAGWFACAYCGSPSAVEETGTATTEAPGGRVVCLDQPGRTQITVKEGALFRPEMISGLITADLVLSALLALVEAVAPAARWPLAFVLYGLLALSVAAGIALACTEQVLLVLPNGTRAFWRLRGRRLRERAGTRTVASVLARGLRTRAPEDERWIQGRVADALDRTSEARRERELPCPGCGGAAAIGAALAEARTLACPWCGASLLVGHTLRLDPLRLPAVPDVLEPARPRRRPGADGEREAVFTLPTFAGRHGVKATTLAMLFCLPFVAAPLAGSLVFWSEVTWLAATRVVVGAIGAALTGAMGFALLLGFWGTHTVSVGAASVGYEQWLFGRRLKAERLPLARVVEVGYGFEGGPVKLWIKTPTRAFTVDALQKPPDGARLVAGVLTALAPPLEALGRLDRAAARPTSSASAAEATPS